MFKELFNRLITLIFRPSESWKSLSQKTEDNETFLSRFIYPLIGLIALAAFLGVLFTRKEFDLEIALKFSIKVLISSFGGFLLGAYLLNEIWHSLFKRERDMKLSQRFVGYSSSLIFFLSIILELFPEFIFLRIFVLYTIYIIWEGAIPYMSVKEDEQGKFVTFASVIIIGAPLVIDFLLFLLMPGFRL